jgi:hypothetical protein
VDVSGDEAAGLGAAPLWSGPVAVRGLVGATVGPIVGLLGEAESDTAGVELASVLVLDVGVVEASAAGTTMLSCPGWSVGGTGPPVIGVWPVARSMASIWLRV